ncbi:MAG TPA: hypothetical protein VMH33_02790 [Solirubrobacterales bacterium]|nr:hypothetical protein [Solirubrobacterales bacterium]
MEPWEELALQAILPICLIGIVLPLGIPALVLGLSEVPLSHAFNRGELFLVGANTAFASCLVLASNRMDRAVRVFILSVIVGATVVGPCYLVWALITTAHARSAHYSTYVTIHWGLIAAGCGLVVAVVFVSYAFLTPSSVSRPRG